MDGHDLDLTRLRRVLLLGATGTIGRATVAALLARGHDVVCLIRSGTDSHGAMRPIANVEFPAGAIIRFGDPTDPVSFVRHGICGDRFDAIISCLASRTGSARDAWAIDYQAHANALAVAKAARVQHFILLSAICVQKPRLAFQRAKLAFEQELIDSGLTYSIVRPTAFFKSLSGQIDRLRRGKPYLLFGDGRMTACKPISDRDLADYLADCLDDETRHDRILPIGGPGEAITPQQQGERLFALLGLVPRYRHVPVKLLDVIVFIFSALGRLSRVLADKAELARIAHYYATESMLVINPETGSYDAQTTPSTGSETLFDFYTEVIRGNATVERGRHTVFSRASPLSFDK